MNIISLFPIPVGQFSLGRDLTTQEIEYLDTISYKEQTYNFGSIDSYILKAPELKKLRDFCQNSLQEYLSNIISPSNKKLKLKITESWVNMSNKGQSHHMHTHSNSFLSGVLYLNASNDDSITFYRSDYQAIVIPTDNHNLHNSLYCNLPSQIGTLYIFPSSVVHGVGTVNHDHRVSISFNSYPVGSFGSRSIALTIKDVE